MNRKRYIYYFVIIFFLIFPINSNLFPKNDFANIKNITNLKKNQLVVTIFYSKNNCINCYSQIFNSIDYLQKKRIINTKKNKLLVIIFEERKINYELTKKNLNFSAYYMQGEQLLMSRLGIGLEEFLVVFNYNGEIIYRYKSNENLSKDLLTLLKN